jgi:hypothetical protein
MKYFLYKGNKVIFILKSFLLVIIKILIIIIYKFRFTHYCNYFFYRKVKLYIIVMYIIEI